MKLVHYKTIKKHLLRFTLNILLWFVTYFVTYLSLNCWWVNLGGCANSTIDAILLQLLCMHWIFLYNTRKDIFAKVWQEEYTKEIVKKFDLLFLQLILSLHILILGKYTPTFLLIWATANIWYNHLGLQNIRQQGLRIQHSAKAVSNNINSTVKNINTASLYLIPSMSIQSINLLLLKTISNTYALSKDSRLSKTQLSRTNLTTMPINIKSTTTRIN